MEKTQKAKIMKKDVIWNELIIYDFFGLPFFIVMLFLWAKNKISYFVRGGGVAGVANFVGGGATRTPPRPPVAPL